MNNEFKKLSQGDITRYVLESGSSGGTSSGSVASVSMPMGGTRKRGDNLIAQEADKKTVPASTPRNFVAKNAKTAGAGAHKDKSKTIPRKEKHKKPFMEDHSTATGGWGQGSYDTYTAGNHGRGVAEDERDHPDHEIQMASSELMSIAKNAEDLLDMVRRYSEQEGLDAWQQSKITKAADYLNSVLQSINGEQQGVAEGSLNELSKDTLKSYSNERGATIHADQRDAGGARIMAADKKKHGDTKASADWDDEASWLDKRAEKGAKGVAQATTKIAKKGVAEDTYFESLQQMVERQLEPTMDLDAWVDNFQNADPNKYHQFKNKTPEKKK